MTDERATLPLVEPPIVKRIQFAITCVPPKTSHHSKRIVKIAKWSTLADTPALVGAKEMLDALLLPHQPPSPVTGAVRLALVFTWPWRESEPKRVRALGRIPHTSKPDASNVTKTLEDRLVALRFLEDDNAVADLHVRKWWGDAPGIEVVIEALASPVGLLPPRARTPTLWPTGRGQEDPWTF